MSGVPAGRALRATGAEVFSNIMTDQLLELIQKATIYDLAQPYFLGMPHHPVHPPFLYGLVKKHGEYVAPGGSSASEALALGAHVGTHIDALCHFSRDGRLHDGAEVAHAQSNAFGLSRLSVDTIQPIFRHGVLLDIAGLERVDVLPADFTVTPEHLERVEFIKQCQTLGFSLDEIRELMELRFIGASPCQHVRDLLLQKIQEVEAHITRLQQFRHELQANARECEKTLKRHTGKKDCCPVLERLDKKLMQREKRKTS